MRIVCRSVLSALRSSNARLELCGLLLSAGCWLVLGGTAFGRPLSTQQRVDELPPGMEPFTETIPGTTVSFTMIPIPGGVVDVEREPSTQAEQRENGRELVEVEIAPFYMMSTEVPWELYDVMIFRFDLPEELRTGVEDPDGITRPTHPYISTDRGFGHNGWPAISISHQGAEALCRWLTVKTGKRFRLPTEDEWEHAARAGTARSVGRWWFGDDQNQLKQQAWFRLNSSLKTHAVGQLPANPFGLFDIYGNCAEWCTTNMGGASGEPDGQGGYVLRGGSYLDRSKKANSFYRSVPSPAWNASDPQLPKSPWWLADGPFAGIRLVCEAPQGPPVPAESAR